MAYYSECINNVVKKNLNTDKTDPESRLIISNTGNIRAGDNADVADDHYHRYNVSFSLLYSLYLYLDILEGIIDESGPSYVL